MPYKFTRKLNTVTQLLEKLHNQRLITSLLDCRPAVWYNSKWGEYSITPTHQLANQRRALGKKVKIIKKFLDTERISNKINEEEISTKNRTQKTAGKKQFYLRNLNKKEDYKKN